MWRLLEKGLLFNQHFPFPHLILLITSLHCCMSLTSLTLQYGVFIINILYQVQCWDIYVHILFVYIILLFMNFYFFSKFIQNFNLFYSNTIILIFIFLRNQILHISLKMPMIKSTFLY